MNVLDWSSQNLLAVGLGDSVYLWNAVNNNVCPLVWARATLPIAACQVAPLNCGQEQRMPCQDPVVPSPQPCAALELLGCAAQCLHVHACHCSRWAAGHWSMGSTGLSAVQVEPLCQLEDERPVCSVAWTQRGNYLAIGTTKGVVRIYDAAAVRRANPSRSWLW